jgi:hypothetical protein
MLMAIQPGDQVFVSDKTLYRTKDGRIVGEDDPDKLTKVAVPGHRMPMARARELGLVTGEGAEAKTVEPTGREDKITPLTGGRAAANRQDTVRPLTGKAETAPAPESKEVRKAPARPRTRSTGTAKSRSKRNAAKQQPA